ncbi:IRK-interacting protein-like [Primulina eburnea]|uniref:IRK-interacting protein-like n=1 Tax=Primulina eburnea TaxID=1245227 RepID=UPI003C6C59D7
MADVHTEHSKIGCSESGDGNDVSRQDIQAAFAKAVELRALHAVLTQGNKMRFNAASSPVSCLAPPFSAQDYPVFTPSYEDEPLPGYPYHLLEKQNHTESWDEHTLGTENFNRIPNPKPRKGLLSEFISLEGPKFSAEDQNSGIGSCANNVTALEESPGLHSSKSRRNSAGELKSVSSCNRCNPGLISSESGSRTSFYSPPRNRVLKFPWLFSSTKKKKNKNESSPARPKPVEVSESGKDSEIVSTEMLKKELEEAKETRDSGLIEVAKIKGSLVDLSQKMEYLETYCEELKKALRQEKLINLPKRGKPGDENAKNFMPVSEEVMEEGFLQIVSETRLSMKQFCKILVGQIEETDHSLIDNMNMHLQPHKLSFNSKYSKPVLYHIEAIINQSLYQDFENCIFQKNGAPKILDPCQDCQAQFQSFVALRNLSWNEVLRKGTKYYSDEFSKFCDDKMSGIIATLGWTRPWPEQLLQAFFVAAKCVWLLHLLAFSFNPPLGILRVTENRPFDPHYMDNIFADRQRSQGPSRVKIMVMPGFYVRDRVMRCKVICRYKYVA